MFKKWRLKVAGYVAIAATLAVSTLGVSAPTASAASGYPSGCNRWVATDGRAYAECTSGTVRFRVGFACKYAVGYAFEVTGNLVYPRAGNQSVATCPWGSRTVTTYPWINVE